MALNYTVLESLQLWVCLQGVKNSRARNSLPSHVHRGLFFVAGKGSEKRRHQESQHLRSKDLAGETQHKGQGLNAWGLGDKSLELLNYGVWV